MATDFFVISSPVCFFIHATDLSLLQVLVTSLSLQQVDYFEPSNFWVGPRAVRARSRSSFSLRWISYICTYIACVLNLAKSPTGQSYIDTTTTITIFYYYYCYLPYYIYLLYLSAISIYYNIIYY